MSPERKGKPALVPFNDEGIMEPDFIMVLARMVLDRIEEIEQESALNGCPELNDEIRIEGVQLLKEIAGLKARLRWIAEGM